MVNLGKQWEKLSEDQKTEEVKEQYEDKTRKFYETLGLDYDESIKRAQPKVNEQSAFLNLHSIHVACKTYKDIKEYYPPDLKTLTDAQPPYILAESIDNKKYGYNFIYTLTPKGYTIVANPVTPGVTGTKRYFVDETGDIRFTSDGTEPSVDSKVLDY
jgi:hypothetical protein